MSTNVLKPQPLPHPTLHPPRPLQPQTTPRTSSAVQSNSSWSPPCCARWAMALAVRPVSLRECTKIMAWKPDFKARVTCQGNFRGRWGVGAGARSVGAGARSVGVGMRSVGAGMRSVGTGMRSVGAGARSAAAGAAAAAAPTAARGPAPSRASSRHEGPPAPARHGPPHTTPNPIPTFS